MKAKFAASLISWLALLGGCPGRCSPSIVEVSPDSIKCLAVRTSNAEFEILRSGYVRARLRRSGRELSLDEPDPRGGVALTANGRSVQDFRLDCVHAQIGNAAGRLGAAGKRIEIGARSASTPALEETIVFETYEDFPELLLTAVEWRNTGSTTLSIHVDALLGIPAMLNAYSEGNPNGIPG